MPEEVAFQLDCISTLAVSVAGVIAVLAITGSHILCSCDAYLGHPCCPRRRPPADTVGPATARPDVCFRHNGRRHRDRSRDRPARPPRHRDGNVVVVPGA